MSTDSPFLLRPAITAPKLSLLLGGGVLASAALQYLWLYADAPLSFRAWGFVCIASYAVPLLFLFGMYRADLSSMRRIRALAGRPLRWLVAALLLVLVFGGVAGMHYVAGGEFDPSWKWTTLALSGAMDLPLVALQLLPLFLIQDLFWRQSIEQAFTARPVFVQMLLSALCWTLSNGVLIAHLFELREPEFASLLAATIFAAGAFTFMTQRGGAFLLSSLALTFICTAVLLLFGSDIAEVNHAIFGLDVDAFDGLFPEKLKGREGYAAVIAIGLLLASLLVPKRNSSAYR